MDFLSEALSESLAARFRRDELLISPCQTARRGGRITMWLCCVIMKGECDVLPIVYHCIPAALSVLSLTLKAGTVWELTS